MPWGDWLLYFYRPIYLKTTGRNHHKPGWQVSTYKLHPQRKGCINGFNPTYITFTFSIPHLCASNGKLIGVNVMLSVSMLSIHDFSCCRINFPFLAPFLCAIIRETTLLGKSTGHSGPVERTDRISTYGSLLWNGRKPPAANSADLVVSWLVYSAARGLGAGSVGTLLHFHAHNLLPPLHQPPSNHLRWSHRMPPPPHPPLLPHTNSFTAVLLIPHYTLNTLCCFTPHCFNDVNEYTVYSKPPQNAGSG